MLKVRSQHTDADIAAGTTDPFGFVVNHLPDRLADTAANHDELSFAASRAIEDADAMAWLIQERLVAVNIACSENGKATGRALPTHRPPVARDRRAEAAARLRTVADRSGHALALNLGTDRMACTHCFG